MSGVEAYQLILLLVSAIKVDPRPIFALLQPKSTLSDWTNPLLPG